MVFRNFLNLRKANCAATGRRIVSMYPASALFPVVHKDYWWSDSWDAEAFGRDFDFSKTFTEQYAELSAVVPRASIMNINCENSEYANFAFNSRNCYLVFGCVDNEDCLYGHIVWKSKDCVDCLYAFQSEKCYQCTDIVNCYGATYCTECTNCRLSYFCYDCASCTNCFGCTGLRNKEYHWFNEPCSPKEYQERLRKILPLTQDKLNYMLLSLDSDRQQAIRPELYGLNNEDITGNHIYNSRSCIECFDIKGCEQSENCFTGLDLFNCYDCSFMGSRSTNCHEGLTLNGCDEVHFSHQINFSHDVWYSEFCASSHDLFGCNGIRRGSYSILNKKYRQSEYERLKGKIITHMKETGEWGEFLAPQLSPFAYNDSIANEYMQLDMHGAVKIGYRWNRESFSGESSHSSQNTHVEGQATCIETGKQFRILPKELSLSLELGIPLPETDPFVRHRKRMKMRAERKLKEGRCGQCLLPIQSANFSAGYSQKVFCEECYLKAISAY